MRVPAYANRVEQLSGWTKSGGGLVDFRNFCPVGAALFALRVVKADQQAVALAKPTNCEPTPEAYS
jgi:hypothetical protein